MSVAPANLPTRSAARSSAERALFITRKWGPAVGGMETYSERLSEELAKLQAIDVVALKGRANGQPPGALALLTFPFTVLRRLIAQREKPAIIHVGDMAIWPLAVLAGLFFPAAKLVLSAHGTDVSYGARGGVRGSLYSAYLAAGARLLSKARLIANSRATRDRLVQIGWPDASIVALATDLRVDAPSSYDTTQILFAGRLITQKGCRWFVENVLPLLPDEITLNVIGTVWDKDEEAALDHPQVRFEGALPQSQLAHRFAKAGCVIIPNIERANGDFEGFGLVAPEASSAGGIVLASDTGGLKDAVIEGETGFLIAPGDAQAWADKIVQVIGWDDDQRQAFITRSKAKAREYFSWSRVAAETAKIYSD